MIIIGIMITLKPYKPKIMCINAWSRIGKEKIESNQKCRRNILIERKRKNSEYKDKPKLKNNVEKSIEKMLKIEYRI